MLQSVPAARSITGYDWSCQMLTQTQVDSVVDVMHTDLTDKDSRDSGILCSLLLVQKRALILFVRARNRCMHGPLAATVGVFVMSFFRIFSLAPLTSSVGRLDSA